MSSNIKFILPKGTPDIPLYKYYSNLDFAVDAIENDRIHLDELSTFNDLYEGAFPLTYDLLDRIETSVERMAELLRVTLGDQFQNIIDAFIESKRSDETKDTLVPLMGFVEYAKSIDPENEERIRTVLEERFDDQQIVTDVSKKCSCFSEVNDSLLMWAYYANKYEGVCLQFDVSSNTSLYQNLRRVSYTDLYYGKLGDEELYFRKSSQWEHEREWRIICSTEEEYLPVKVTGIYYTKRMKKEDRDKFIRLAIEKSLDMVLLYPRRDRYELELKYLIEKGQVK